MKPEPHSTPASRERLEWLSALADGQTRSADAAWAPWRDDEQARRSWHAYHLIGDVLRSAELAREPAHDAAFLAGVRARLAQEPVVLAPVAAQKAEASAPPSEAGARPAWTLPVALAASVVVVAGVALVARLGPTAVPGQSVELATAAAAASAGLELRPLSDRQALVVDPRLEEFLRLHQASGGGMAAAAPGGALRRVDIVVPVQAGR